MAADTSYPTNWDIGSPQNPAMALQFAVESYIAALSDTELDDLLARTRPGGTK